MGSVVAKNGRHAQQLLQTLAHARSKKTAVKHNSCFKPWPMPEVKKHRPQGGERRKGATRAVKASNTDRYQHPAAVYHPREKATREDIIGN